MNSNTLATLMSYIGSTTKHVVLDGERKTVCGKGTDTMWVPPGVRRGYDTTVTCSECAATVRQAKQGDRQ